MQILRPEIGMFAFISCGEYRLINQMDLLFGVDSQNFFYSKVFQQVRVTLRKGSRLLRFDRAGHSHRLKRKAQNSHSHG